MKRNLLIMAILVLAVTRLLATGFGGGTGTALDPFLVSSPAHLNNVRNHLNAHFRQTAHIDLNVAPYNAAPFWTPLAVTVVITKPVITLPATMTGAVGRSGT